MFDLRALARFLVNLTYHKIIPIKTTAYMKKSAIIAWLMIVSCSAFAQEQLYFNPIYIPHTDTTSVFTPRDYSSGKKYPVLFLLHGCGGNYKQWSTIINVQKYADAYGFIVVCPDGLNDSWYINSPRKSMSRYEDFFFKDLLPAIKQKYHVEEESVFITGMCSGGHGALNLFAKKPELFRAAGSTAGVMDLRVEASNSSLRNIMGDADGETLKRFSMISNLDKIAASGKEIIFDCGNEDVNYQANNVFRQRCDEMKVKATYIAQTGKHDKAYWKRSIKTQFDFFKRIVME
jgi:putative tributyrin esterase